MAARSVVCGRLETHADDKDAIVNRWTARCYEWSRPRGRTLALSTIRFGIALAMNAHAVNVFDALCGLVHVAWVAAAHAEITQWSRRARRQSK